VYVDDTSRGFFTDELLGFIDDDTQLPHHVGYGNVERCAAALRMLVKPRLGRQLTQQPSRLIIIIIIIKTIHIFV